MIDFHNIHAGKIEPSYRPVALCASSPATCAAAAAAAAASSDSFCSAAWSALSSRSSRLIVWCRSCNSGSHVDFRSVHLLYLLLSLLLLFRVCGGWGWFTRHLVTAILSFEHHRLNAPRISIVVAAHGVQRGRGWTQELPSDGRLSPVDTRSEESPFRQKTPCCDIPV